LFCLPTIDATTALRAYHQCNPKTALLIKTERNEMPPLRHEQGLCHRIHRI
jgi:hypothetical protein